MKPLAELLVITAVLGMLCLSNELRQHRAS